MYLVLFFHGSRIDIRSAFLRLIISNCYVDGGKARFSLKKLLSLFVKTPNMNIWQSQWECFATLPHSLCSQACSRLPFGCGSNPMSHGFDSRYARKNKPHHLVRFIFWQDILCNSRTDEIRDLLQFGKEIKVFLTKV